MCTYYDVTLDGIVAHRNTPGHLMEAKKVICAMARERGITYMALSRVLNIHHTTIMYYEKKATVIPIELASVPADLKAQELQETNIVNLRKWLARIQSDLNHCQKNLDHYQAQWENKFNPPRGKK